MISPTRPLLARALLQPSSFLPRQQLTGAPAAFLWRFGTFHAYSYAGGSYLDTPQHALYELSKKRWLAKQEPLWASFVAVKSNGENSRCVRSWLARRLRNSFFESLRKRGYAWDGTPLEGGQRKEALYGTVQLLTERAILKIDPKSLEEQTDKVVDKIIRLQKWNTAGLARGLAAGQRRK
jgi:hypothetical protein